MNTPPATQVDLVIVCQVFYPELVSTGQTLTELAEELAATGLRITVIAAQPTLLPRSQRVSPVLRHGGMTIIRTWSTRLPKTSFIGKLLNLTTFFASACLAVLFQHPRAQLLLLTNPPFLPFLGWLCYLIRRQPFGVLLFDIMPEQAELLDFIRPKGVIARVWRRFNRLWYRKAAYTVVLSREMREGALANADLLGNAEEPAARAKTHVIPVWSDDRLIAPRPKAASAQATRLGVQECLVIQYSGNHGRFHDIETLLALAARFQAGDGFVFQFIGEGQKKKLVDDLLSSASPPPLYSSSYVPKQLLADSLAMADLGVVAQMPGQERVCYPSKLLGIMAAGRPVLAICPVHCDMARMIREQEIGFVIANGDVASGWEVLLDAKANPARLQRMGENAASYLRAHFTLSQAARAYYDILSSAGRMATCGASTTPRRGEGRESHADNNSSCARES